MHSTELNSKILCNRTSVNIGASNFTANTAIRLQDSLFAPISSYFAVITALIFAREHNEILGDYTW
jgi:hypothetical protein